MCRRVREPTNRCLFLRSHTSGEKESGGWNPGLSAGLPLRLHTRRALRLAEPPASAVSRRSGVGDLYVERGCGSDALVAGCQPGTGSRRNTQGQRRCLSLCSGNRLQTAALGWTRTSGQAVCPGRCSPHPLLNGPQKLGPHRSSRPSFPTLPLPYKPHAHPSLRLSCYLLNALARGHTLPLPHTPSLARAQQSHLNNAVTSRGAS